MSDWVHLTEKDLQAHMLPAQLQLLRTVAPLVGGEDPLRTLLREVVAQIRAAVRNGKNGVLSGDVEKIPEELLADASALVLEALQSRLIALKLSPDQVRAAERARDTLLRIGRGEIAVSRPLDPAYHLSGGGSHLVCLHQRLPRIGAVALRGL
ncbi:MAG: hypothetical protein LBC42_01625 [Puniceicoccales bacterium]|jgi:hypothetical protein|nr:hypothetical protein [Puniceicoccales bacterium]